MLHNQDSLGQGWGLRNQFKVWHKKVCKCWECSKSKIKILKKIKRFKKKKKNFLVSECHFETGGVPRWFAHACSTPWLDINKTLVLITVLRKVQYCIRRHVECYQSILETDCYGNMNAHNGYSLRVFENQIWDKHWNLDMKKQSFTNVCMHDNNIEKQFKEKQLLLRTCMFGGTCTHLWMNFDPEHVNQEL